jgi:hypothetical protein
MVIDIPVEKGTETELMENEPARLWGRPIYRHRHFMQADNVYSNEVARKACTDYVQNAGCESFFEQPGWRRELMKVAGRYKSRGRTVGAAETKDLILADLVASKRAIEARIGGDIHHLCYPYGAGDEVSTALSRKAGFKTNIWQTLPYVNKNRVGNDPFRLVRLKKDFLQRMPGDKRRSLADIYLHKAKRRIAGKPYH